MNFATVFWSVDTYHEGDKFPSIVGAVEGLSIFSEVNNQYGFVSTYLSVPFIEAFGAYLIVNRIVGFCIKLLTFLVAGAILVKYFKSTQVWGLLLVVSLLNPAWSVLGFEFVGNGSTWPNRNENEN
jgi:hypothetical protein